jgi:hypothetical protein
MTIVFIILLINLNISVLFLIFLNPKNKVEIKTINPVNLQEPQELKDPVSTDSLLNKVYRDEISKRMKVK